MGVYWTNIYFRSNCHALSLGRLTERESAGRREPWERGKFFPCQKRQNGGRNFQKALRVPFHRSMGPILRGGDGSLQVVWRTDLEVDLEQTQHYCVEFIGPISTTNDCLNIVFNDVFSLCGSCRHDDNALPRSPREKH